MIKDAGGFKVVSGGKIRQWQKTAEVKLPEYIPPEPPIRNEDLKRVTEEILEEADLKLEDLGLHNRLKNLVVSRLKDVRNKIETLETLKRPVGIGGLGFDERTAERVIKIIERRIITLGDELRSSAQEKSELELELNKLIKELNNTQFGGGTVRRAEGRKPALSLPKVAPRKEVEAQKTQVKKLEPEMSFEADKILAKAEFRPEQNVERRPQKEMIRQSVLKPAEPRRPEMIKQKQKITTKLTGPVEEIRDLTIEDFRKLDLDPQKAAENIYNKMILLEKDSFTKKMAGIVGWRQSQIFKNYVEIGNESMEGKKSVEEIIAERQAAGKPTLSIEEFEAVMDLNQKLRF